MTTSNAKYSPSTTIVAWPYMVEHAVDCQQDHRPTWHRQNSIRNAYEQQAKSHGDLTIRLPRVCSQATRRLYQNRLRVARLDRRESGPGTPYAWRLYNIWVPDAGKTVCTSEVYFDEGVMPWRPKGDQRVGDSMPTPPPTAVAVDALDESAPPDAEPSGIPPPVSAAEAYDRATRGEIATARRSQKVLVLFSGPYRRPDGLAAFLTRFGFDPVLLDNDPETGGGADGDIQTSTRELRQANAIVARMTALLTAAFAAGTQYIIENPADRGDPARTHDAFSKPMAVHLLSGSDLMGIQEADQRGPVVMRGRNHGSIRGGQRSALPHAFPK